MKLVQQKLMHAWARLGPRYLPFADVATPDLPLSRLLRLSLFPRVRHQSASSGPDRPVPVI